MVGRGGDTGGKPGAPHAKGKMVMAFTDVETAQAHDAVSMDPTGEDLCKLGLLYSTGQCGVVDMIEAHKWFNLAALMGSDAAKHYRSEVAADMEAEQIQAALSAARQWLSTRH